MKKIFTLCAAFVAAISVSAETESYKAVTYDGSAYTASAEFANAVIADGASHVRFGTANMEVEAVGGTTAKDVFQEPGTDFAGWTEYNDVKWDLKNQGDITYGYIVGTGNPAMEFTAEEVLDEGERTGHYRPKYTFYTPDCGKAPVMGLYIKFTAKAAGDLKIYVWSNKGNRNTFLIDAETAKPVDYKAEGYINGQNYPADYEDASLAGKKKWLTAEEIQTIHDNAKCQKDADGNIIPGTDSAPYCIGAGNQPFWGVVTYTMAAGQSVMLFQDSSQIGFQGYEFTSNGSSVNNAADAQAEAPVKVLGKNGIMVGNYNVAGQLVK